MPPKESPAEVADTQPDIDVVKPEKDADGNEWTVTRVANGFSVTVTTKSGQQSSVTQKTVSAAKEILLKHIGQ